MKKIFLAFAMIFALLPVTANAISFVNLFTHTTGEVMRIDGDFVYISRGGHMSRVLVKPNVYVLGEEIQAGDTITVHRGMSAGLGLFSGQVLDMTRTSYGNYRVRIDYDCEWRYGTELNMLVDFSRGFRGGHFNVGDVIEGFYSPWGGEIFDMPFYHAVFVVNGDYEIYLGQFNGEQISNTRLIDAVGVAFDPEQFPKLEIRDGDIVAVVFGENGVEQAFVLNRQNIESRPVRQKHHNSPWVQSRRGFERRWRF
jgi:hypothetical protein